MPNDEPKRPSGHPTFDELSALQSQLSGCKQYIQALKNSEQKLRSIFEASANLVAIATLKEGRYIDVNKGFTNLLGYTRQEVVGRTSLEVGVWIDPEQRSRLLNRLMEKGRLENVEVELKTRHEEIKSVILSARVMDIDDEPCIVSFMQDITDRKSAEQALRESEALNRSIFHAGPIGIGIMRDRVFLDVNDRFCEIIGWTRDELIGKEARMIYPSEEDYKAVAGAYLTLRETGFNSTETRFICKKGKIIDVLLNAVPINPKDLSAGITFTMLDITERKRTEQALRESEERLRLAFDAAYVFSFEWDIAQDQAYRYASKDPVFTPTLENSNTLEQIVSMVHPEDRERFTANVFAAMERESGHYENEYRVIHPDGMVRWFHEDGLVKRDVHNRPVRLIGLSQDITDRKNAELKLQQVNETLERQVAERTELAKRRANQLQSLAVELIEAEECERKRISGLLHDDLQQMIAAAKMQLQSVTESMPKEPTLPNVQKLLDDSLHKSRQLSHELCPPVLYHTRFVDSLHWLTRQMKDQFGLNTELEADENLRIEKQPLKVFLFRAVQELLFNIIKHSGVKEARVALSATGNDIVIGVSDSGRGFDPGILDKGAKKAGLGLLSLRERAIYIGGNLIIESAPGSGSRFILRVPVKGSQDYQKKQEILEIKNQLPESKADISQESKGGMRVLFVDDHKVIRQGLTRLVAGQPDIEVAGEAANGQEAIELARQLAPDVVVMDVSMPGMDGFEATRRIKAEMPNIRVIGLSMHDDEQISQRMVLSGAETLISKTSSSSELIKAIYGIRGQHMVRATE